MIPAAGDFDIMPIDALHIRIQCPQCRDRWIVEGFPTIRDLIGAASEHARTHAMSVQPATTGA